MTPFVTKARSLSRIQNKIATSNNPLLSAKRKKNYITNTTVLRKINLAQGMLKKFTRWDLSDRG
jgi:hypothetical protein